MASKMIGVFFWTLLLLQLAATQYVLFTPREYHVGVAESIVFTNYNSSAVTVTAQVTYEQCECVFVWGFYPSCTDREEYVFSQSTASTQEGPYFKQTGKDALLTVQMPSLRDDLSLRNYYISVFSLQGEQFLTKTPLSFSSSSFGFLLVKTDKPIYKPAQTVSFCLIYVDKNLKPMATDANVTVAVRDSKYQQIIQWKSVNIPNGDFACLDFPLSEEPLFGTWKIEASLMLDSCGHRYSLPRASCSFKVQEFVLPKFEVKVSGPSAVLKNATVYGKVSAKYTFGESVSGDALITATLLSPGKKPAEFYQKTGSLVNGSFKFAFSTSLLLTKTMYQFNPFCFASKVLLTAKVTEGGRGTVQNAKVEIPLAAENVEFKFDDKNSKFFRPGLNYTVKVLAKLANGLPIGGAQTRLMAVINNGQVVIHDELLSTGDDGVIEETVVIPFNASCLKIILLPSNSPSSCQDSQERRPCLSPAPFFSPTGSFIQLTDISEHSPLRVGSTAELLVSSTIAIDQLHYLIVGQGGVILHNITTSNGDSEFKALISFGVTFSMSPRVRVLVVLARKDGELVADVIEMPVNCQLPHQVAVSFSQSVVAPGDDVVITTKSGPSSLVLLSVIDSSLNLLADTCESASKDNVCILLKSLLNGYLSSVSTSCPEGENIVSGCCPPSCSEPDKHSVTTVFKAAGIDIQTNMFQPVPFRKPENLPPYPYPFPFPEMILFDFVPVPEELPQRVPSTVPDMFDEGAPSVEEADEQQQEKREYFPESWVWSLQRADEDGMTATNSVAPDTITSWTAGAIALSRSDGLGISELASITVKKDLFVSLELPYSINWGETVVIQPVVLGFFDGHGTMAVVISVSVDPELSIIGSAPPTVLTISAGVGESFNLTVKARSAGHLPITVSVREKEGQRQDTVTKILFVKPGCKKHELSETLFIKGEGKECFDYILPSCTIPGSAEASLTVTGDIMSFPDVDYLIRLPTGCGEQNLIKTGINYVVGMYLSATDQLSSEEDRKIRKNIQIGYQQQLNFFSSLGCFSIWPNGQCSSWLTAAVVNVFSAMSQFYEMQGYAERVVDQSIVDSAVRYILSNQKKGRFNVIGKTHIYWLMEDKGSIANTAFTLVALKQYSASYDWSSLMEEVTYAIKKTSNYLTRRFRNDKSFCTYGLAISVYALHCSQSDASTTKTDMKKELISQILPSTKFPGTCYVCSSDCSYPWYSTENNAVCVETTGYALLALLSAGDLSQAVCLAQWLVRIRSNGGGYYSSQDTIIALEALSMFARLSYSSQLNLTTQFLVSGLQTSLTYSVTDANRLAAFSVDVQLPSSNNCVQWSGQGVGILQSVLVYYGCTCDEANETFALELSTEKTGEGRGSQLVLHTRMKYLGKGKSNMVILDVEMPSGYAFAGWQYLDESQQDVEVQRREVKGSDIVLYLSELSDGLYTSFSFTFFQQIEVTDAQPSPVTVFDYYEPTQAMTKYYFPEADPLPTIATSDDTTRK